MYQLCTNSINTRIHIWLAAMTSNGVRLRSWYSADGRGHAPQTDSVRADAALSGPPGERARRRRLPPRRVPIDTRIEARRDWIREAIERIATEIGMERGVTEMGGWNIGI
ncbi:MAG: hypothetical protein P4L33_01295 [Capsulimonadaceae bacterium]|nr:hypothetical protein [Capsulimonadaceae bacterium]